MGTITLNIQYVYNYQVMSAAYSYIWKSGLTHNGRRLPMHNKRGPTHNGRRLPIHMTDADYTTTIK